MEYKLIENTGNDRFEMHIDGFTPFIKYQIKANKIYLIHTEVPKELGGRGIGSALLNQTLEVIQKRKLKVVPICSFVEAYFTKHPKWKELL